MKKHHEAVVVVGGAVAGSALANALGSRGIRTLLIERLDRERHGARGDLLHPPTLRILDRWGVLPSLHADGALALRELAVTHAQRGLIARYATPARGDGLAERTIAVPHDRIEAVLAAHAERKPNVRVERAIVTTLVSASTRATSCTSRAKARPTRPRRCTGTSTISACSA